jgi:hypothetical protein
MASAAAISAYVPNTRDPAQPSSVASPVAALAGQIRQLQSQLNDWTTCVSAKTTKGQAAIQKLSGQISAAKEQMQRILQGGSGSTSTALQPAQSAQDKGAVAPSITPSRAGRLDAWA